LPSKKEEVCLQIIRALLYNYPPAILQRTEMDYKSMKKEHKAKRSYPLKNVLFAVFLVLILVTAVFAGWYYWWVTHADFDFTLQPVVILYGQTADPNDFLYPDDDKEFISATFSDPGLTPKPGAQNVRLTLTYGLRTLETFGALYVLTPVDLVQNEFAVEGPPFNPIDFLSNADIAEGIAFDVHFITEPMPRESYPVGEFTLHLALNGVAFDVPLSVTDNTPPTADPVDKSILVGEEVRPEDFITNEADASPIASISFVEEPDVFSHESITVEIEIEDYFGNIGRVVSHLEITLNETPPVIDGVETIVLMAGNEISDFPSVTAFDDFGRELELHVESSAVDQDTVGEYSIVFWTVDYTGQLAEIEVAVYIVSFDPSKLYEKLDEVLAEAEVNEDGMTQREKVEAIHTWITANISQTQTSANASAAATTSANASVPRIVYEAAYAALDDGHGDSFAFYSIAELLLTRAGIPNMRIERTGGTSDIHFWNLVNPDDLGWHHFDSFPNRLRLNTKTAFFTDSESKSFSEQIHTAGGIKGYYDYDPDLYPEIARGQENDD